jgi:hypothetical protein
MRMWNIDTKLLCNQHLLGEHVEMHMFVGSIKKGHTLNGYIEGGLVDTRLIQKRHDQLALELKVRGMHHCSPLKYKDYLKAGDVDIEGNLKELSRRCLECRKLKEKYNGKVEIQRSV